MKNYKIFAINPGSTSTKVALFEGDEKLFSKTVDHDAAELDKFAEISQQLPYRMAIIDEELGKSGISLKGVDAFVGQGGGLVGIEGGTYPVNDILHEHARTCFTVRHPATLGAQIARKYSQIYGGGAYVVNPPDVDEFSDLARVTGLKGVYRESRIHGLNQKEIGIRYAAIQGKKYEDMNLIICHAGGGLSVTAHKQGKMVDSNDIANGDGPMAPTRCGTIPVKEIVKMCFAGNLSEKEIRGKITQNGGWVDHLGTSDARVILDEIERGDFYSKLIFDATIYQVAKYIGSCAVVLKGNIDAIILTGGISNSKYFADEITKYVSFLAPVAVMAGEFEMEAMAAGVIRVLEGEEEPKEYTGIPIWSGFDS